MADLQGIGSRLFTPYYQAALADALLQLGRPGESIAELEQAMESARGTDARFWHAELYRLRGEILARLDPSDGPPAEASFRMAIDIAREQQARGLELRAAVGLARMWDDQGRAAEGRELLAPVYGQFTEGLDTPDLQDAKALLEAAG